jgi:Na+/H+ antiporter NhaD/arsenite permease-like protein
VAVSLDLSVYLSLACLFGIASQFRAMEGESFIRGLLGALEKRVGLLFAVVIVAGVFSPVILNDVVIIIVAPVLIQHAKDSKLDIAPLLVALISFTNIASSLTPFGNPQNILLWSASKLSFVDFVSGTAEPLILSAALAVLVLFALRNRVSGSRSNPASASSAPGVYLFLVVLSIALVSDVLAQPVYLALGIGFLIGFVFNARSSLQVLLNYDLRSLLTLYAFVASITILSFLLAPELAAYTAPVASGSQPYSALFMLGSSNVISNVPATQLVLSVSKLVPSIAPKIAVEAGLAGNVDPIASFANLLALLMARRAGVPIRKTIALQFVVGIITFLPAFL